MVKWLLILLIIPLSGCATYYKICTPGVQECSEVRSYRKIAVLTGEKCVTEPDGTKTCYTINAEGIDSQSATMKLADLANKAVDKIPGTGQ